MIVFGSKIDLLDISAIFGMVVDRTAIQCAVRGVISDQLDSKPLEPAATASPETFDLHDLSIVI